ncbi:MAG: class I SAM-dependent methyltransferase [Acidobacteriota bacterium]|nr:class I SAM-dependent methyltransferase [Acidobacteriota bacterium]
MTFADTATLLQTVGLACGARRILEIGTGAGQLTLSLAAALPPDGMMISMEADAALAGRARNQLAAAGHADRVSVMVGEAARFLHKIAGPFDLIVQTGAQAVDESRHERLVALLRPNGVLVTDNIGGNGDSDPVVAFSHRLAADPRLQTSFLPVGGGVAISVKRAS